jgi:hypothetical protein
LAAPHGSTDGVKAPGSQQVHFLLRLLQLPLVLDRHFPSTSSLLGDALVDRGDYVVRQVPEVIRELRLGRNEPNEPMVVGYYFVCPG